MGGDHAPQAVVEGAALAVRELDCTVILVGDREVIEPLLANHPHPEGKIIVKHASEVVRMDESPRKALNTKQDTSIRRIFELIQSGEADAAIRHLRRAIELAPDHPESRLHLPNVIAEIEAGGG